VELTVLDRERGNRHHQRMQMGEGVAAYYVGVTLATLCLYAWDKRASKRPGAQRVRERTLHLWALAGGFGGALIGQFWLRHKTRHPSFIIVTVLALAAHAGAWAWWLRGGGFPG
jgi:uncharacterized membrane protein YsdA (DUF1294 family)